MIPTRASSLACFALSSFLVAPCLAATEKSEDDVRAVLAVIKGLLNEQIQCLEKLTSAEGTEDARKEYTRIIGELLKTHELLDEDRLILHFAQFPEEEKEVIHIIQRLAKEISRVHKEEYYQDSELEALLVPPAETP